MTMTPEERARGREKLKEMAEILGIGKKCREWKALDTRRVAWLLKALGKGGDPNVFLSWSEEERAEFRRQMRELMRFCSRVLSAARGL
ncbi:MAG: hypothetical protein LBF51_11305 [Zoogloeaceae bacterium]|jgi:hypothetical protein|nr:hypothetical protein [Zoogloeaceae bacterium]